MKITITIPDAQDIDEDALDDVLNALDDNSILYEWIQSD